MRKELYELITDWIEEHYGETERNDPCYDIAHLCEYLEQRGIGYKGDQS